MTTSLVAGAQGVIPGWLSREDCRLEDFVALVEQQTTRSDYPLASGIEQNVVVYDAQQLSASSSSPTRLELQTELVRALTEGPGIAVFKGAFLDLSLVDRASDVFHALIAEQRAGNVTSGDHFAKPGVNDRVWNALEKLAVRDPQIFVDYYANDVLNLISVAWLGPGYQVTSQVNVVNPGGEAQTAHRDYHLGFMSEPEAAQFPAHVHRLSPALTLQGAVAHSDMPVETGPTLYLPYSHQYDAGYLAFHRPEFTAYFQDHFVQLPLKKGDAVFFNPALFHGAGHNRSADVRRMANLLQVSSAFGRAMESVDRAQMVQAVFPALRDRRRTGMTQQALTNVVAATAEGYAFPTNLDRDQPVDGLAPQTQAQLLWQAVEGRWRQDELVRQLEAHALRRGTA